VQESRIIGNIQLLRGLAALGVVLYHTAFLFPNGTHTEFYGVAIFFTISGFIMVHVSRGDTSHFIRKRLLRIVPLYWFATIVWIVWVNFGFSNPPYVYPQWAKWAVTDPWQIKIWFVQHAPNVFNRDMGWSLLRSLAFWPSTPQPILSVGWTLNIEMFFYVLFGLTLRFSQRWAPLIASVILIALYWLNRSVACGPVCTTFGHGYVLYFVHGICCWYVWQTLLSGQDDQSRSKSIKVDQSRGRGSHAELLAYCISVFQRCLVDHLSHARRRRAGDAGARLRRPAHIPLGDTCLRWRILRALSDALHSDRNTPGHVGCSTSTEDRSTIRFGRRADRQCTPGFPLSL
jgi:peptidoglycan/LPS O-acetylase OafA/YrhL